MSLAFSASASTNSGNSLYNATVPSLAAFTEAFWVYLVSDLNRISAFTYRNDHIFDSQWILVGTAADGVSLYLETAAGNASGSALSVGAWYHVCLVKSGSSYTVYLNGKADITRTDGTSLSSINNFYIGGIWGSSVTNYGANMVMAGYQLFNAALNPQQVQRLTAQVMPDYSLGYPFHSALPMTFDTLAQNYIDLSGNNRNWSAGSAPSISTLAPPVPMVARPPFPYYFNVPSSGAAGTASITLAADTFAGSGGFESPGSAAITLAADSVAGSGAFATGASASFTLNAAAVAGVGDNPSAGTAAITLSTDTFSGSGAFSTSASAAFTLGADTVAGVGDNPSSASASITLGADTFAGTGAFAAPASAAFTLATATVAGSGGFEAPGSAAIILGADTVAGSGSASAPGTTAGTAAITLGVDTVVGSGSFSTSASAGITLGADSVAGVGGFTATASSAITLGADTVSGSGSFTATAAAALTLNSDSVAGSGGFAASATAAITLSPDAVAGLGAGAAGVVTASAAITLEPLLVIASGQGFVTNRPDPYKGTSQLYVKT